MMCCCGIGDKGSWHSVLTTADTGGLVDTSLISHHGTGYQKTAKRMTLSKMTSAAAAYLWILLSSLVPFCGGNVTVVPVFAPLSCPEPQFVNYSLSIQKASDLYHGLLPVGVETFVIDSCYKLSALKMFVDVVQNESYPVIIGPAEYSLCSLSDALIKEHQKFLISWSCAEMQQPLTNNTNSYRTLPDSHASGTALSRFLMHFKWKYITIITLQSNRWSHMAMEMHIELSVAGFDVRSFVELENTGGDQLGETLESAASGNKGEWSMNITCLCRFLVV